MSLKRSLSKKFKNTFEKTKRIVSPSIDSKKNSTSDSNSIDSLTSSSNSNPNFGLGINVSLNDLMNNSDHSSLPINSNHTPTNSLSSIPKSCSNHDIKLMDQNNQQPALLYSATLKRRSYSIRRKSKQHLDSIDTSITASQNNDIKYDLNNNGGNDSNSSNTNNNNTSTDNTNNNQKTENNYIDDDGYSDRSDVNSIQNSHNSPSKVILLPIDPIDKSIPPCTTEQLTPIIPISFDSFTPDSKLLTPITPSITYDIINNNGNTLNKQLPPLIISNISASTSFTLNSVNTPLTLNSSPMYFSSSDNQLNSTVNDIEVIQNSVNPIFTKANQIDHLDKDLDIKQNDKLADQMALNILHNITEENVDELSKFKEEISMKF